MAAYNYKTAISAIHTGMQLPVRLLATMQEWIMSVPLAKTLTIVIAGDPNPDFMLSWRNDFTFLRRLFFQFPSLMLFMDSMFGMVLVVHYSILELPEQLLIEQILGLMKTVQFLVMHLPDTKFI